MKKNILIATLSLMCIGFFFYGLINRVQAEKERELSLQYRIELIEMRMKLEAAKEDAMQQKTMAEQHAAMVAIRNNELAQKIALQTIQQSTRK